MLFRRSVHAPVAAAFVASIGVTAAHGASQETGEFVIEEIVVTALKHETILQETPLAITVVSGETLVDRGIDNVSDLLRATPGLAVLDQGAGQRRLIVRGVQSAGEAQTGLYYDETPIPGAPSTTNDAGQRMPEVRLVDVERIEVLRGPQGTLYGAGSMGGTVRALFNKPTSEFATAVTAGAETSEEGELGYEASAMVNVPLGEQFAMRVVGFHKDLGGYIDNLTLHRDDVNTDETTGGRVLLRYAPSDALTIDAAVHIQREDAFTGVWELPAGDYRTFNATQLPITDDFELYNLTLKWDLGFATLTGVSSQFNRDLLASIDGTRLLGFVASQLPLPQPVKDAFLANFSPAVLYQPQDIDDRSHELRLNSNGEGPLTWTLGAYFEKRDAFTLTRQLKANAATGLPVEPEQPALRRTIDDQLEQRALFGEISFDFTQALTLTLGGRYFDYDKSVTAETTQGFAALGIAVSPPTTVKSDEDGFVSKVNLSYKINERALLYAMANEGFRPGGANQVIGLPEALTPYEADSLWNYEIGAKTRWFNDRMTLNLAAFRIDWDNMQVTGTTSNGAFRFISNAGAAQIDGVELEAVMLPLRGLELSIGGAYTDAKLSEDQISGDINAPGRKGDRLPNVPQYTASFAAEYRRPFGATLFGSIRTDFNYVGSSHSELRPNNVFNEQIDDYTLTNLRLRLESLASNWNVDLFVNNVFDEVAINRVLSNEFGRDLTLSAPPRTVGISLGKSF